MYKILQRIDRIRASGYATLNLPSDSPHYHLDGKRLPVKEIGTPDYKCRVTVLAEGGAIDFCISEIL
ncbi:hypothetical protein [Sphingobacterium bambusae]|uniref:Uncharacterized protein n=1 Tax=Sphingobacterium bambusae TaxID=662858 RepID=A0ABW6BJI0_9SPHI|nr:hypothetical protein [Sphingobacterium bambusae]WPL49370.1 hypothetical protein SCB77_02750 [Sphingobacterium bambusae]